MQNTLRNPGKLMLLVCLSLSLLTGCSQRSKLKLLIEAANKQCPFDLGMIGEVSTITFDGTDVIYTLAANEDYIDLDALSKNPAAMNAVFSSMIVNPDKEIKEMIDLVVLCNSGMKFVYKGKVSGKEAVCSLTAEEIRYAINQEMDEEASNQKKLEEMVNVSNVSCPLPVDNATMLDKLTIESDQVVYNYTIDEEIVTMASMKERAEEIKQQVRESLKSSDPALVTFLGYCKICNKGLGYRYKGNTSDDTVEFSFTASEIKGL